MQITRGVICIIFKMCTSVPHVLQAKKAHNTLCHEKVMCMVNVSKCAPGVDSLLQFRHTCWLTVGEAQITPINFCRHFHAELGVHRLYE